MRVLFASFVLLLILLSGCVRSDPRPQPPAHSKATVIVEQSAVTPGNPVNLGIQFVMDEGWHIYWQNPGDSGEPPRIQWHLPAGVTTGAMDWPTPTRLTTTAGTDYGYQGTVVLLSSLQVPATAPPGRFDVTGDLRWLVCRDICIPQRTQLKFPVRIAQTTSIDDAAHRLLQSAAEHIPTPLPASVQPVAARTAEGFRLTLVSSKPIKQAHFFPSEEEQIDNGAPQELTSRAGVMRLALKKSEYSPTEPQHLRGVIVLNGKDAYQLDVPIHKGSDNR